MTANPAKILKLKSKGRIAAGMDADLCLLDANLDIDTVIARGQVMVQDGRPGVRDVRVKELDYGTTGRHGTSGWSP